jgi:peptidoglycan hydrolase-like protein with peptidoglycan-binding domain
MATLNGWTAASGIKTYRVPGTGTYLPVKAAVAPLLIGFAKEFHETVQPLHTGWCWGYAYRAVRGYSTLSYHAFGLAIDLNAPAHPLGRTGTFSYRQRLKINALCRKYGLRWGGNYSGRKDEMHFECILTPAQAAAKIRALQAPTYTIRWPGAPKVYPRLEPMDYGKTNKSISYLQGRLTKFGAQPGKIDGYYGDKTKRAVSRVQRYYGGEGKGVMNAWTYKKMWRREPPK